VGVNPYSSYELNRPKKSGRKKQRREDAKSFYLHEEDSDQRSTSRLSEYVRAMFNSDDNNNNNVEGIVLH